MKHFFLTLILAISLTQLSAQLEKCGTMVNRSEKLNSGKEAQLRYFDAEQQATQWRQNQSGMKTQNTITIPVVFHCVYKTTTGVTNIPDSVFQRQIDVMNETYGLTNSNFSSTRSIFDTLATNTGIQFCLAAFDPQGNPSNGIVRYQNSQNWLSSITNDAIKTTYPPWDPSKYLNVWTCDMSLLGIPIVLGYATFPGEPAATDGIVLQSEFVGFQNNGTSNNLGRTMVHEVGHYLGLRHIWGDGQQSSVPCDSTDYVDDTPHAADASQTDCDTTKNSCSTENVFWSQLGIDPPDMVENYMDYSTDGCMTMFTKGQSERMWSFLSTIRSDFLSNSVSCASIGINEHNPAFADYVYVFPNPASDRLQVNLTNASADNLEVTVYNSLGQIAATYPLSSLQNTLDISCLGSGIHFIKVHNPSNFCIKKIIKN